MKCSKYRIEFVDRVLDPVHGFIDMTQIESEIVSLPIFRRMQDIKQLSMTNWVFPGAEHNRYIHSLGVMYIVDQMALHLEVFNDGERQLLRLAGLLHDVGHYPLSHVTENVYRDRLKDYDGSLKGHNKTIVAKINGIYVETEDGVKNPEKAPEYMMSRLTDRMHHESIGAEVIKSDTRIAELIKKYCDYIEVEDICDIIVGNVDRNPNLSIYAQLMHSELDADGIDYIMRDASFSGTSYGGFELGVLLRNLTIGDYNGTQIVGVKPKGIPIADQYLINKYFSYSQIIFNKHVAILEFMVEKISHALIDLSQSSYPDHKTLMQWIKKHSTSNDYLLFTDIFFWSQIRNRDLKDKCRTYIEDRYITNLFDLLVNYEEPAFLDEAIISTGDRENACDMLQSSQCYNHLVGNDEDIFLFHSRPFTKEIPTCEYDKILSEVWKKGTDDDLYVKMNTKRLQEGVTVIEQRGSTPTLLVDDPRSVMAALWRDRTYILRRYKCI